MTEIIDSLKATLGDALPSILGALAVRIVGWFAAMLLRAL
ncbi:MAG: mechanosensitive ion channel family protein, partial [Planctomycetota bacterium]